MTLRVTHNKDLLPARLSAMIPRLADLGICGFEAPCAWAGVQGFATLSP